MASTTKKPDIETVKNEIITRGGIPLFDSYVNARSPLKIKTQDGAIIYKTWFDILRTKKSFNVLPTPLKLKKFFELRKEKFLAPLDKEIVGATEKLTVECEEGHVYHPTWNNVTACNSGCPVCAKNIKFSIEYVKNEFIKRGYTPLFSVYKETNEKLKVLCPFCKKPALIKFSSFIRGHDCSCQKYIKSPTLKSADIITAIEAEHYTVLEKEKIQEFIYKNDTEIQTICPKGTHYKTFASRWLAGNRCKCCRGLNSSTEAQIIEEIESAGFEYIK